MNDNLADVAEYAMIQIGKRMPNLQYSYAGFSLGGVSSEHASLLGDALPNQTSPADIRRRRL